MKRIFVFVLIFAFPFLVAAQYFQEVTNIAEIDSSDCSCWLGRGISFTDLNKDFIPDLSFATNNTDSLGIYTCEDGVFSKVVTSVSDTLDAKMTLWVDLDNDGDKDLVVANYKQENKMFRNDGNLQLVDITSTSGFIAQKDFTYSITAGDVNNDGFLDLFVSNYLTADMPNQLYINNGNMTFTESHLSYMLPDSIIPSFIGVFVDFDKDGWQDLYLVNDRSSFENMMFKNIGGTHFENVSASSGTNIAVDAMNGGIGDFNEDGWMDIYVSNGPPGNFLFLNNGDFTFTDVTDSVGVGFYRVGWGGTFRDVDNDSDLDLYVCGSFGTAADPNALYINQGPGSGFNYLEHNIPGDTASTFVNAFGDYNMDGKIDFALSNNNGFPHQIFENVHDNQNNWVKFNLKGRVSNRDGIGTQTTLWRGSRQLNNYLLAGESYLAQHSALQHFGLENDTVVESIIAVWPSGTIDTFENLAVNKIHTLIEGASTATPITVSGEFEPVSNSNPSQIEVQIQGEFNEHVFSDVSGLYSMDLPEFASVNIVPRKDTLWAESVTISDLVQIQQHLLFSDTLDSPYKIIAADANNDGSISISDLNALLQIIVTNWDSIPGNTSYRFVPTDYIFSDPTNPLTEDFPESIQIEDQVGNVTSDFKVIKVGNVFD